MTYKALKIRSKIALSSCSILEAFKGRPSPIYICEYLYLLRRLFYFTSLKPRS